MKGYSQVSIKRALAACEAYNKAMSEANDAYLQAVISLKQVEIKKWWWIKPRSQYEIINRRWATGFLDWPVHEALPDIFTEVHMELRRGSGDWKESAIRGLCSVSSMRYINVGHELSIFIDEWDDSFQGDNGIDE